MDLTWKLLDYLMDFRKVRAFQELCGLEEASSAHTLESESISHDVSEKAPDSCSDRYDRIKDNLATSPHIELCDDQQYSTSKMKNGLRLSPEDYAKTYNITNWILYYIFRFGSTLGHEIFYMTVIPCIFWNLDPFIARKMVIVWVVTMYIGQALKDIIQWPRPHWPPVFKLETRVETEYGIPSTHAVAGTALPFSFLLGLYNRYEFSLEFGILIACGWCLLVALSRLYVGMHSILDVMAGVALAAVYLWLGWPFMDMVDEYTMTSTYAPAIIIPSHFLLGVFYPNTNRYSTSRGDTVVILAVGAGIHFATWMCHRYRLHFGPVGEPPYSLQLFNPTTFLVSLSRALLGFVVIFSVRMFIKSASLSLVCWAVGASKRDPASRRRKDVEITYKFITYAMVGFSAVFLVPLFLQYIGLVY